MATEPEDSTYFVANLTNEKDSDVLHILPSFSILDFEIRITDTVELAILLWLHCCQGGCLADGC